LGLALVTVAIVGLGLAGPGAGRAHAQAEGGARKDTPPPPKAPTLTRPPELLEGASPVYPPEAIAAGLEADVTVRIFVDAAGQVSKVLVVNPVGHGFDEAAQAAALRYRFRPAEWDGKPGPIVVETTISFRLETVEVPATQPGGNGGAGAGGAGTGADTTPATPTEPTGRLEGTIKERGTRRKLAGVTVAISPGDQQVVTDENGRFDFGNVAEGNVKVFAVLSGFDRYQTTVVVSANEVTDATLYLRPKGSSPYESTIEAEKDKLEVTKRSVDRKQMTTVPGTFGDPLRVIQNLPGMNRAPYAVGILLIRGSNPDDSGVYVDGHEIPILYHFLGGPSILNPEFLEKIDLFPGGFPARFGRAIGGIVDVETRSPKSDGIHGSADVDLIDASVYLRAPVGQKVTFAFAARRSYIDALLPFVLPEPDPGSQLVVVPYYWDYQARIDVNLDKRDRLSFMLFGSFDKLELLQSNAEATFDLDTSVSFHRGRAAYRTKIGPGDGLELTLSATYGKDAVRFAGGSRTAVDITQDVTGVRERVRGDLGKRLKLDAGVDIEYRITRYDLNIAALDDIRTFGEQIDVAPEQYRRNVNQYALGAWTELAIDAGAGLRLIPSVRLDGYFLAGEGRVSVDPRFVARWQRTKLEAFKSYIGWFHQPPAPEGFDNEFGNRNLELEWAVHAGVGYERVLAPNISLETEAYVVGRRNLAVFTDEVRRLPDGTIKPLFWKNEAIGQTYGLEVLLRHDVTRNFYGWLSYTLSRSEQRRHPDEDLILTTWDATHNLILVASYRTDAGWELGLRFRATTGRPENEIQGGTYDTDADSYRPVVEERRTGRRPFFHQLDLRAEKTWLFDTWSIGAYLDVLNVYNAQNPEATQWDYRYRENAPVRGLPIVPTIGVKGSW
jgi:TonB family protein